MPQSGGVPTRLQELLDLLYTVFIGRRVKHIERHGLPRIIKRCREWTYAVQVAVRTDPCQPAKCIRGEE
jgi:hypothetical protein